MELTLLQCPVVCYSVLLFRLAGTLLTVAAWGTVLRLAVAGVVTSAAWCLAGVGIRVWTTRTVLDRSATGRPVLAVAFLQAPALLPFVAMVAACVVVTPHSRVSVVVLAAHVLVGMLVTCSAEPFFLHGQHLLVQALIRAHRAV